MTAHPPPHIVFMGTPEFAVASLNALVRARLAPMAVVTAPDKARGRSQAVSPCAVKSAALGHGITHILQPESVQDPAFARDLAALEPDIIVVVAFRILPPEVYGLASMGAFNLHGSLLPAYRGAAPIHRAVMAGESETGVTTFFLQEKVDTGHIILRRAMPIGPDETMGEVHDRMMVLGAEVVVDTVRLILEGRAEPTAQDDALASPAPKVHKSESRIDWAQPVRRVHDFIRGLSPIPGAWTLHRPEEGAAYAVDSGELPGTRLAIYRTSVVEPPGEECDKAPACLLTPGTILRLEERLHVACADGYVELRELQQAGRRRLPAPTFLNGSDMKSGDRLE